jgi:hypothetical protein
VPVKDTVSIDRRTEKREPKSFLVRYSGPADLRGRSASFVRFASTINVSKSGLCFRSPMPFEKTHRLSFMNDELWEDDMREGVVKWCEQTKSGIYKVGVALV